MTLLAAQDTALEPVRAAMLLRASEEAGRIITEAREAAAALTDQARRGAEAAVGQARSEGAEQARPVAAAELGRSRRAARSAMLRARRSDHDELAGRIRAAICGLRDEAGYVMLRDRLAELARQAAGPGATVTDHPDGGVVARADGVVVDCSLPRLADRVVAALSPRIDQLCGS